MLSSETRYSWVAYKSDAALALCNFHCVVKQSRQKLMRVPIKLPFRAHAPSVRRNPQRRSQPTGLLLLCSKSTEFQIFKSLQLLNEISYLIPYHFVQNCHSIKKIVPDALKQKEREEWGGGDNKIRKCL